MSQFEGSRLLLSAGTLPRASFVQRVSAAKAAGFDAISLFPQHYLAAQRKEKLSPADMVQILTDHEMALDEVDPLLDWVRPEASPSEQLMLEMADTFGARSVNVAAAFVSDKPFNEIVDHFAATCERIASHGLRVDLEFLPWTQIDSLTTAFKVLEQANQPNAGVMFDFWHFFNSRDDLDNLESLSPEQARLITSLQLNDKPTTIEAFSLRQKWEHFKDTVQSAVDGFRVMGRDSFLNVAARAQYPHPDAQQMMKEALCSRLMPGAGDQPVQQVFDLLAAKGVTPTIGVEVFNIDQYALTPEEVARRAMASYRALLSA